MQDPTEGHRRSTDLVRRLRATADELEQLTEDEAAGERGATLERRTQGLIEEAERQSLS